MIAFKQSFTITRLLNKREKQQIAQCLQSGQSFINFHFAILYLFNIMQPRIPYFSSSSFDQKHQNQVDSDNTNPQDQLLFKLPTIQAKKHALKMLANEVRSLGSEPNSNLKAFIIILLKTAYGKQLKSSLIMQLKKQINNPSFKFTAISNNPLSHKDQNVLKALFIHQLDLLTEDYKKKSISLHAQHNNQLLLQTYLTQNEFLMQIFILLFRCQLTSLHIPNANNYKLTIQTEKIYQNLAQIYNLNCRLMGEYSVFYDQSLLIASADGKQYVYGRFYQDENEMQRSSKLSASTLQFLNMLSANHKKRKEILIQSQCESSNSQIIEMGQNLLTPSFQLDENIIKAIAKKHNMTKSQQKKEQIRINFSDKLGKKNKNEDIGQVITNIQMIQSMHQQISVQNLDRSKSKSRKPNKQTENIKNSLRNQKTLVLNKRSSDNQTAKSKQRKENIFLYPKGPKFLEMKKMQSTYKQYLHRNESFEFRNGTKTKNYKNQLDVSIGQRPRLMSKSKKDQSRYYRYCFCKQVAKKKNQINSNVFSLSINLELTPLNMKSNKNRQIQTKQKRQQKKEEKINSTQFQHIFRKKNLDYSNNKDYKNSQNSPGGKEINKLQPGFLLNPLHERLAQEKKMLNYSNQSKKAITLSDELGKKIDSVYNRNVQAICSPKPYNIQSKSRGYEFKPNRIPTFKDSKIQKKSGVFDGGHGAIQIVSNYNPKGGPTENLTNIDRKFKLNKHTSLFEDYQQFKQK